MITSVDSVVKAPPAKQAGEKVQRYDKKAPTDAEKEKNQKTLEQGDIKKVTYDKPKAARDEKTIAALKKESEKAYRQLRELVEQLLKRQGYNWSKIAEGDLEGIEIDQIAIDEAKALIAEDGPLGAEKTSERIFQFAVAISGGDKTKLEELKKAIDQGFKEVEGMLGGLPEVSQRTYELVMEKLDRWYQENE